jgi:hypothetical protein
MSKITTQIIIGKTRSLQERVANENLAFKLTNRNHIVVVVSPTNVRRGGQRLSRVFCDLFNFGARINHDNPGLDLPAIHFSYPVYHWSTTLDLIVPRIDPNGHFVFGIPEERAQEFAQSWVDGLVELLTQQATQKPPRMPWPGSNWEQLYVDDLEN